MEQLVNALTDLIVNHLEPTSVHELNVLACVDEGVIEAVAQRLVEIASDGDDDRARRAGLAVCRLIDDYGYTLTPPTHQDREQVQS